MLSVVVFSFLLKDLQKTSITAALPSLSFRLHGHHVLHILTRDERGTETLQVQDGAFSGHWLNRGLSLFLPQ